MKENKGENKDKKRGKNKTIKLRCTGENHVAIERNARKNNLTVSEFLRRLGLSKRYKGKNPPKVNWRTYRELGQLKREALRVGTNINQIAKQINEAQLLGKPIPDNLQLAQELSELKSVLEAISREIVEAGLRVINIDPTATNE